MLGEAVPMEALAPVPQRDRERSAEAAADRARSVQQTRGAREAGRRQTEKAIVMSGTKKQASAAP